MAFGATQNLISACIPFLRPQTSRVSMDLSFMPRCLYEEATRTGLFSFLVCTSPCRKHVLCMYRVCIQPTLFHDLMTT